MRRAQIAAGDLQQAFQQFFFVKINDFRFVLVVLLHGLSLKNSAGLCDVAGNAILFRHSLLDWMITEAIKWSHLL